MMKRLLAAAFFLIPGIAQAEYFETGNDLAGLCTDNFPGHNYLCLGLPAAYFDMMQAMGYRCASTGVTREQVRDSVLRYLAENPDKRNQPASELALTSLKTAFQCVEPAPPVAATPVKSAARSAKPKGKASEPISLVPIH
jgi:hypothetical protein